MPLSYTISAHDTALSHMLADKSHCIAKKNNYEHTWNIMKVVIVVCKILRVAASTSVEVKDYNLN